jgi:hypothetical protein
MKWKYNRILYKQSYVNWSFWMDLLVQTWEWNKGQRNQRYYENRNKHLKMTKNTFLDIVTFLSDYRRVLDWQSDLLHLTTKYNWVSPDSLGLTIHDWIYHDNSAVTVSTATALLASFANTILVAAQLQVPFLSWPPTHSLTNYLSGIYDLWTDCREETFLVRIPRKHPLVVS